MFRLEADAVYKVLSPALFAGARAAAELGRQRCVIEAHLSRVKEWLNTQPSFITKEAIVHAGLMRRYGHGNRIGDSFVAVDTEIVFEFPSRPTREHFNTTLCTGVRLAQGVGIPTELDTLGVLDAGDVAVVEVKDHARDVVGAASQVAAHVFRFRYHAGLKSVRPLDMIAELCRQKASVGLLPKHVEKVVPRANFVPVIAAPDGRNDWVEIWRQETQKVRDDNPALLNGLRFWRLESEEPNNGEILEEVVA